MPVKDRRITKSPGQEMTMEKINLKGIPLEPLLAVASRCVVRVLPFVESGSFAHEVYQSLKFPRTFSQGRLPSRTAMKACEDRLRATAIAAQSDVAKSESITHAFRAAEQTLAATRKAVSVRRGEATAVRDERDARKSVQYVTAETLHAYLATETRHIQAAIESDLKCIRAICGAHDTLRIDIADERFGPIFTGDPPASVGHFDFRQAMASIPPVIIHDDGYRNRINSVILAGDLLASYPTICFAMLCGVLIWPSWGGAAVGGLGMASLVGWAANRQATRTNESA